MDQWERAFAAMREIHSEFERVTRQRNALLSTIEAAKRMAEAKYMRDSDYADALSHIDSLLASGLETIRKD